MLPYEYMAGAECRAAGFVMVVYDLLDDGRYLYTSVNTEPKPRVVVENQEALLLNRIKFHL